MSKLTLDDLRRAREILDEQDVNEYLCDKVVAVLGDDLTYPCKFEANHKGRCEPDYNA